MPNVKPTPDGYHSVTPYLTFKSADTAIEFYQRAFGAKKTLHLHMPNGAVAHAEIQIGDSHIMLADENPVFGNKSPETLGGSPTAYLIYVDDVDSAFDQAVNAGATVKMPVRDQFYGDRVGTVIDPFGYQWSIGTHKEDVSVDEMQHRMEKMFSAQ